MSSSLWSLVVLRWPHPVRHRKGRRFWSVASGAAAVVSAGLVGVMDGLWSSPPAPVSSPSAALRLPGFALTRGAGFLSRGEMFALQLRPEGARLTPACPAGRCQPIELRLVGGRAGLRLRAQDPLPATAASATGGWLRSPSRLFASVLYDDVYPGIALRFRGQADEFNYAFLIDRGASPQSILLELDGVERLVETPGGGILATSPSGTTLALSPPSARQDGPIDAWYVARSQRQVALDVGLYDVRRPLAVWGGRAELGCPHR